MSRRGSKRKTSSSEGRPNVVRPKSLPRTKLLPTIDGPKIGPFKRPGFKTSSDFRFEALLRQSSSSDGEGSVELSSSEGGEGYVFKATLGTETYALKLFKFYDVEEGRFRLPLSEDKMVSDEELIGNLDPFYAECRAYGRIQEIYNKHRSKMTKMDTLAVPCYGYIFIPADHERDIMAKFGKIDMQRYEQDTGTPIRALVKRYVPTAPLNPKIRSVKRMLRDLKTMHAEGLYPIDIRAENYRGGLLVDFGQALTEPSCVLRVVEEDVANGQRIRGLAAFDKMIEKAGIKTQVRAFKNPRLTSRTRQGSLARGRGEFMMLTDRLGKKAETIVVDYTRRGA